MSNEFCILMKGDTVDDHDDLNYWSLNKIERYHCINQTLLLVLFIIELLFAVKVIGETKLGIFIMKQSPSYETVEYRGASITYYKKEFQEDKLYIFYTVVDSLVDDVKPEYAIGENPMNIYMNRKSPFDFLDQDILAFARESNMSIFLKPQFFDYKLDDGHIAMTLLHEYIHIVQYGNPNYLDNYSKRIGWDDVLEKRNQSFYMVLDDYSLENSSEDMASTYMYTYLCGNDLWTLSDDRLEESLAFWSVPREEFCRNFPSQ